MAQSVGGAGEWGGCWHTRWACCQVCWLLQACLARPARSMLHPAPLPCRRHLDKGVVLDGVAAAGGDVLGASVLQGGGEGRGEAGWGVRAGQKACVVLLRALGDPSCRSAGAIFPTRHFCTDARAQGWYPPSPQNPTCTSLGKKKAVVRERKLKKASEPAQGGRLGGTAPGYWHELTRCAAEYATAFACAGRPVAAASVPASAAMGPTCCSSCCGPKPIPASSDSGNSLAARRSGKRHA